MKTIRLQFPLTLLASVSLIAGCTKQRAAAFPDGQGDDIVPISLFQQGARIETENRAGAVTALGDDDSDKLNVVSVQAPDRLRSMFKGLLTFGKPATQYAVAFSVAKSAEGRTLVTANRVVSDERELNLRESMLAVRDSHDANRILVPIFQYEAKACGTVERARNDLGEETSNLRLKETDCSVATHVQVSTLTKDRMAPAERDQGGGYSLLPVARMKDQEFFMRRTLMDTPNGFDTTFAGVSGNMEIVRFVFEQGQVRVVRSRPLLDTKGTTAIDSETLMSFPARYFVLRNTDPTGAPTAPQVSEVKSPSVPGAIVKISWFNQTPNISSPLEYFGLEQCFNGKNDQQVEDVDSRLGLGYLGFTEVSTYAANAYAGCTDLVGDYFGKAQANFTFKERIAFKAYDSSQDQDQPLLDVPYGAQKKLGFGLFTYKKVVPNGFGNTDKQGTSIPLPSLFDIRGGKKVTYVLAGLPEDDGKLRDRLIQATREVIADINRAFREALKGTPMERSESDGDVLELKIEGQDVPYRKLGDLERNYIYLISKKTSSPIIGLGGSHASPRSGHVEAASVFIYTGNILSYSETLIRRKAVMKDYLARVKVSPAPAPQASPLAPTPADGTTPPGPSAEQTTQLVKGAEPAQLKKALQPFAQAIKDRKMGGSVRLSREMLEQLKARKWTGEAALYEAVQEAIQAKGVGSARKIQTAVNSRLAEIEGLSQDEMLRSGLLRRNATNLVLERVRAKDICVMEKSDLESSAALEGISEDTDPVDAVISVYKPTLAHELGHNLGMRHNFMGSYDGANHTIDAANPTKGTYSSIMDYLADDDVSYIGFGKHDVASLRFAYAGMLEVRDELKVTPEAGKKATLPGTDVEIVNGQFVRVNDLLPVLGAKSWLTADLQSVEGLAGEALHGYRFCSDEEVGYFPACNQFDRGTSPGAIVDATIQDYNAFYALRNFPNDKLQFSAYDTGAYIGRLFSMFTPIRQFLDETFYQAIILGADGDTVNAHVDAALKGMQFFHQVIRTPDAPGYLEPLDRFTRLRSKDGAEIVVEQRYLHDAAESDSDPEKRLTVRGTEFDKIVSLMMLTERNFGFPRYDEYSLHVSYPDFERILFGAKVQSKLQLPTVGLLAQILTDDLRPAGATPEGNLVSLPSLFKADVTDSMRFYGLVGSIVSLDVDGLEITDNLSKMYRVMSGRSAPKGALAIVPPGTDPSSPNELKYWAFDQAEATSELITESVALQEVSRRKDALKLQFDAWVKNAVDQNAAQATDEGKGKLPQLVKQAASIEKSINGLLKLLPVQAGPRDFADIKPVLMNALSLAGQLQEAIAAGRGLDYEGYKSLDRSRTQLTAIATQAPVISLALGSLTPELTGLSEIGSVVGEPSGVLAMRPAQLFLSVHMLNQFFYMAHDEYKGVGNSNPVVPEKKLAAAGTKK